MDIIILIPFWIIVTGINLYIGWYFFHCKTLYEYKDIGNGKIEKTNPERVTAYAWEDDSESGKANLAIALLVVEVITTFVTLIMVLQ